jgi:hypothetical protein
MLHILYEEMGAALKRRIWYFSSRASAWAIPLYIAGITGILSARLALPAGEREYLAGRGAAPGWKMLNYKIFTCSTPAISDARRKNGKSDGIPGTTGGDCQDRLPDYRAGWTFNGRTEDGKSWLA